MVIHTFGDSHSWNAWDRIEGIKVHHLGAKLCYSVGRDGLDISNFHVNEHDTVIFCFGEIDCRCHVHKHVTEGRTYQDIIDQLVHKYLQRIKETVKDLQVKTCIYNIVPPTRKKDFRCPVLSLVTKGSDDERRSYVLYFNQKLAQGCKDQDFLFFDIYDKYTDADGFINRDLSDDNVHIKDETYLRHFIEKHQLGPIGGLAHKMSIVQIMAYWTIFTVTVGFLSLVVYQIRKHVLRPFKNVSVAISNAG